MWIHRSRCCCSPCSTCGCSLSPETVVGQQDYVFLLSSSPFNSAVRLITTVQWGIGLWAFKRSQKHPVGGFGLHSAPQFGGEALLHFLSLLEQRSAWVYTVIRLRRFFGSLMWHVWSMVWWFLPRRSNNSRRPIADLFVCLMVEYK